MPSKENRFQFQIFRPFPSLDHAVCSKRIAPHHSEFIKQAFLPDEIIFMKQVHGNRVLRVDKNMKTPLPPCDGIMTNCKKIALVGLHADCQVAIFYDPVQEAIAVVHAGWRGQVQEIYAECIRSMGKEFSSHPSHLRVAISPSLGPAHSEFIHHKKEIPESWSAFLSGSCHFDLWQVAKWQLMQAGILQEHIELAGICTYASSNDYFSYRRDKGILGHNATVACLR